MPVQASNIPPLSALYKNEALRPALHQAHAVHAVHAPYLPCLDRVALWQGDITTLAVDAIVNAANSTLLGGGGVDGAIHRAAGRGLLAECMTLNGCDTGDAKITNGYLLPAHHVIHTVGPIYSRSEAKEQAALLSLCYERSLLLAVENGLKHIAFPSISTGVYGYPIEDAAHVALRTVRTFLESNNGDKLDLVVFVVWGDADKAVYQRLLTEYFPPHDHDTV